MHVVVITHIPQHQRASRQLSQLQQVVSVNVLPECHSVLYMPHNQYFVYLCSPSFSPSEQVMIVAQVVELQILWA